MALGFLVTFFSSRDGAAAGADGKVQYVTIQQIPQLVAVQPETQKSQESTSHIVLSNRNQQVMHLTQSIVQIAAAPVQT